MTFWIRTITRHKRARGQNYDFSVVSIVKNSTNAKMNEKRLDLQLQTLDYLYSNINERKTSQKRLPERII